MSFCGLLFSSTSGELSPFFMLMPVGVPFWGLVLKVWVGIRQIVIYGIEPITW